MKQLREFRMVLSNSLYLRLVDYCAKVKKSKRAIIRVAINNYLDGKTNNI